MYRGFENEGEQQQRIDPEREVEQMLDRLAGAQNLQGPERERFIKSLRRSMIGAMEQAGTEAKTANPVVQGELRRQFKARVAQLRGGLYHADEYQKLQAEFREMGFDYESYRQDETRKDEQRRARSWRR